MKKFHLSDSGPAPCKAHMRDCPVGGEHFDSMAEAGKVFEKNMKNSHGIFSVKTRRTSKKMLVIGGALLSTVSLAACNNSEVMKDANAQMTKSSENYTVTTPKGMHVDNDGITSSTSSASSTNGASSGVDGDKIQSKINEYVNKAKNLNKDLNGIEDSLGNGGSDSSSADSTSNGGDNSSDVLFQGKSLKVSKDEVAKAQELLNKMTIAPEHDGSGYNRTKQFGKGFENGVMAKAEHRDLPDAVFSSDSLKSRAVGGYFIDAYTGKKIEISKQNKADNDIDHIVALGEVYKSGGWAWSQEKRVAYANNLDNLAEVSSKANRSKGDADDSQYVPSYEPSQCRYVVKQIEVKANYHLSMDPAEKAAAEKILSTKCN